ncbi:MAG: biopolymer transporter ExbD [Pseudomonadota bacterium]
MSSRHQRNRRDKQRQKPAALNLVSLMDIFTILVFFLMVNSSEVEVLQTSSDIKLPDSTSEQRPENRLTVSVSADDIVVQGRAVARVDELRDSEEPMIDGLREELIYQAERKGEVPEGGFQVTIMGDQALPYWLLKKIMLTCQDVDFARISLAVNKVEPVVAGAAAVVGGAS